MSRVVTYGEPEWVGVKGKPRADEPVGFWQVRVIVEYRPCFFARLFGYKAKEEVKTYTHLSTLSKNNLYSWLWLRADGSRMDNAGYDSFEYRHASNLCDHVKDFIEREKMLAIQQQIIDRSRA